MPQNWWVWRNVIPAVADRYRVIAADLRGHGWTEVTRGGYGKRQLAADLLAVLDALEVERVTWVGHDWGGWAGFLAADREPARFERMLTLCIPNPWAALHPARLALLGYQVPLSLPVIGRRIAGPTLRRIIQSGRGGERLAAEDVKVFDEHLPGSVSVAMYRTFLTREVLPFVRGHYLGARLEVPTTLLIGGDDLVTRGTHTGPVADQPQLHVESLPGVAHWLPEQRPDAIVAWLARR